MLGLWNLHPFYFEGKKNTFLGPGHPISNSISPGPCDALGVHCSPGDDQQVKFFIIHARSAGRWRETWACFPRSFPCDPWYPPVLYVLHKYWLLRSGTTARCSSLCCPQCRQFNKHLIRTYWMSECMLIFLKQTVFIWAFPLFHFSF